MFSLYLILLDEKDAAKFEQIYKQYRQLLFHVANGILKDSFLSEDAVQQAFLRIVQHIEKISDPICPETKNFAVIIVRNTALDLYNKRRSYSALSIDEMEDSSVRPQTGSDEISDRLSLTELQSAIAALSDSLRETLCLRYVNGYTVHEIAKLLEISEDAARKRLTRAKEALWASLKERGRFSDARN